MLTALSQQDPRWSGKMMGNSGVSIGKAGCLLTDLTMMYDWFFNKTATPDWVASHIQFTDHNYSGGAGLVIWASITNVGLHCVTRTQGRNDSVIQEGLANPNECVMLQVNNSHWLFLIGRWIPLLGYKVIDPWDGRTKYTNAYGNNITGSVVIGK